MMTMMVATRGLMPAAYHMDRVLIPQRPFAIVIVADLLARWVLSIFLMPTLYVWIAREGDLCLPPKATRFKLEPALYDGRSRRSGGGTEAMRVKKSCCIEQVGMSGRFALCVRGRRHLRPKPWPAAEFPSLKHHAVHGART